MRITRWNKRELRKAVFAGRITLLIFKLLFIATMGPQGVLAGDATASSITLAWTAPGDDGYEGTASEYDIRYLKTPLTIYSWDQAMKVDNLSAPHAVGSSESVTVENLEPATEYYFAIKTADEVPNWSGLSNIIVRRTLDIPPSPEGISPPDAGYARDASPFLVVANVDSEAGEELDYFFEISLRSDFSTLAARSDAVPAGAKYTMWQANTALINGITYYWRARVRSGSVYGKWSRVYSFAVDFLRENRPPGVPEMQYPVDGDTVKVSPPGFAWLNAVDEDSDQLFYEMEIYDSAGTARLESVNGIGQNTGPSSSFTSRYQFSHENWYRWKIRAFDGTDYSAWSNDAPFYYIELTPPGPIIDLIAETGEEPGELALTWTVPERTAGYQIGYSRDTLTVADYSEADLWPNPPQALAAGLTQSYAMTGLVSGGEYWIAMVAMDESGNASGLSNIAHGVAGFDFGADADDREIMPIRFWLSQNYPNPFNPTTAIEYSLPSARRVTIRVFNVLGQLTTTLAEEVKPAGIYSVSWDGTDDTGRKVASGVYSYLIIAGADFDSKKMILLK